MAAALVLAAFLVSVSGLIQFSAALALIAFVGYRSFRSISPRSDFLESLVAGFLYSTLLSTLVLYVLNMFFHVRINLFFALVSLALVYISPRVFLYANQLALRVIPQ